ncbi:MAG: carboxylesterase [Coxiella sp. DG_40]|nr:MAG: carboxylesterase [Coxiella sp. DG_40]
MQQFLDSIEIKPSTNPKHSVIWLHGLGADGHDFADMVPQFNLAPKLGVRFIFPHAPMRSVTLNAGYRMRAWFDIYELDVNAPQDEDGVRQSQELINRLIEREISLGIPSEHIVLAGFSQGGAMALHCGLRYLQKLAGILVLSGFLPLANCLADEISSVNKSTAILMIHGKYDNIVPIKWAEVSKQRLIDLGLNVLWKSYPIAHHVCNEEILDISNWLRKLFST